MIIFGLFRFALLILGDKTMAEMNKNNPLLNECQSFLEELSADEESNLTGGHGYRRGGGKGRGGKGGGRGFGDDDDDDGGSGSRRGGGKNRYGYSYGYGYGYGDDDD